MKRVSSVVSNGSMPTSFAINPEQVNTQQITKVLLGAAIFDLSGLPKTYLTRREDVDVHWVQTIFQALGLQSIIASFLPCDDCQHAVVHGNDYSVVVMAQPLQYAAVLIDRADYNQLSDELISWMKTVEPATLIQDAHFREAVYPAM
ncbi:MAG: hypothetical protein AAFR31_09920 [Cyanobacteria bacterium J06627_8]